MACSQHKMRFLLLLIQQYLVSVGFLTCNQQFKFRLTTLTNANLKLVKANGYRKRVFYHVKITVKKKGGHNKYHRMFCHFVMSHQRIGSLASSLKRLHTHAARHRSCSNRYEKIFSTTSSGSFSCKYCSAGADGRKTITELDMHVMIFQFHT